MFLFYMNPYLYVLGIFMFKFINELLELLPANFNDYFKSEEKFYEVFRNNFFRSGFSNKSGHKLLTYQDSNL